MHAVSFLPAGLAGILMVSPISVLANAEGDPPPESPHSLSANIGVVSNYIWRGLTQTDDKAAVQGGLDYSHSSGFYAGTWVSNVDWGTPDPNYEVDLYLGYSNDIVEDLTYDLKAIYFAYPDGEDVDQGVLGGSLTYKWFTLGLEYTVYAQIDDVPYTDGDWYFHGEFEYTDLPFGLGIGLRAGYSDFKYDSTDDLPSADYWHYGATISKDAGDFGTFSLNWDQNNGDPDSAIPFDNDPKFWVGWLKEF